MNAAARAAPGFAARHIGLDREQLGRLRDAAEDLKRIIAQTHRTLWETQALFERLRAVESPLIRSRPSDSRVERLGGVSSPD